MKRFYFRTCSMNCFEAALIRQIQNFWLSDLFQILFHISFFVSFYIFCIFSSRNSHSIPEFHKKIYAAGCSLVSLRQPHSLTFSHISMYQPSHSSLFGFRSLAKPKVIILLEKAFMFSFTVFTFLHAQNTNILSRLYLQKIEHKLDDRNRKTVCVRP